MAKRPTAPKKTLSAANLAALGADRLAELLMQATVGDANLKRLLKLHLAAAAGPADLALEIDKRLTALEASGTRVSWRKRPELIADLQAHRRMIVDRLAATDPAMGLERLVAWFDLYPGLRERVKDPKEELSTLFFDAAPDLAAVASPLPPDVAATILAEAVETRLSHWAGWLGRAAPDLGAPLARTLLMTLTQDRPRPTGRRALVVRKLADRAGDADLWAASFPDEDKARPEVGAAIASRFAEAGRAAEARTALDASRPRAPEPARWTARRSAPPVEVSDAWQAAEIAVLDAEGRSEDAQAARWAEFERMLAEGPLRAFIARLPDFEDVEALDRAHALAAAWFDAGRGLAFLMAWPALREAATMVLARADDLRLDAETTVLWASRLQARYPNAAVMLLRSRVRGLARLGFGRSQEVRDLSMEAAALLDAPGASEGVLSHAAFIDELEALSGSASRRPWREDVGR